MKTTTIKKTCTKQESDIQLSEPMEDIAVRFNTGEFAKYLNGESRELSRERGTKGRWTLEPFKKRMSDSIEKLYRRNPQTGERLLKILEGTAGRSLAGLIASEYTTAYEESNAGKGMLMLMRQISPAGGLQLEAQDYNSVYNYGLKDLGQTSTKDVGKLVSNLTKAESVDDMMTAASKWVKKVANFGNDSAVMIDPSPFRKKSLAYAMAQAAVDHMTLPGQSRLLPPPNIHRDYMKITSDLFDRCNGKTPTGVLKEIEGYYYTTDRPGGDCDAYGSWEPKFLELAWGIYKKNNGLKREVTFADHSH